VTALACSPTEPLFIAATASPSSGTHHRGSSAASPLSLPSQQLGLASAADGGGDSGATALSARRGACGAWNLRAFKRSGSYTLPGDPAIASLAFSRSGSVLAAGTETGRVALFDPGAKPQPSRVWTAGALPSGTGSATTSSGVAVAFRSGGAGEGSVLTLRGGCIQEWSLANLRAPVAAIDLAAAAMTAVAQWGAVGARGVRRGGGGGAAADLAAAGDAALGSVDSDPPHVLDDDDGGDDGAAAVAADGSAGSPWSFLFNLAASPSGSKVAVVCGGSSAAAGGAASAAAGCVLLYDVAGGVWKPPQVVLVSELLMGRCVVDWHPHADVLVCGSGAPGGTLMTLQLP